MMRFFWGRVMVCFLPLMLSGCHGGELAYQPLNVPYPIGVVPKLSQEQITKSIESAALAQHWTILSVNPGWIRLSISINGKHTAVSDVLYDQTTYGIKLSSSENLRQDNEGHIHHHYNTIIRNLQSEIDNQLARLALG